MEVHSLGRATLPIVKEIAMKLTIVHPTPVQLEILNCLQLNALEGDAEYTRWETELNMSGCVLDDAHKFNYLSYDGRLSLYFKGLSVVVEEHNGKLEMSLQHSRVGNTYVTLERVVKRDHQVSLYARDLVTNKVSELSVVLVTDIDKPPSLVLHLKEIA
jgi:hypothetical protein